jgi:hypothetical protein
MPCSRSSYWKIGNGNICLTGRVILHCSPDILGTQCYVA